MTATNNKKPPKRRSAEAWARRAIGTPAQRRQAEWHRGKIERRLAPVIECAHDGLEWIRIQEKRFLARRQLRKQIEAERDLDMRRQVKD